MLEKIRASIRKAEAAQAFDDIADECERRQYQELFFRNKSYDWREKTRKLNRNQKIARQVAKQLRES